MRSALLIFAEPTPLTLSLVIGGTVALLGILTRAWAAGHIHKFEKLAVTGPVFLLPQSAIFRQFFARLRFRDRFRGLVAGVDRRDTVLGHLFSGDAGRRK